MSAHAAQSWVVQWAPVLSAAFAAIAATATALGVAQARRIWLAGLRPELSGRAIRTDQGTHELIIENGGGGLAQEVAYALAVGDQYSWGYLPAGFLRPGEGATLVLHVSEEQEDAPAMVACRDVRGQLHAFSMVGRQRVRERRWLRKQPLTPLEVFLKIYPDVDVSAKRQVGGTMPKWGAPRLWGQRSKRR